MQSVEHPFHGRILFFKRERLAICKSAAKAGRQPARSVKVCVDDEPTKTDCQRAAKMIQSAFPLIHGTTLIRGRDIMSWQVLYLRPRCEKKMAAFAHGMGMDYRLPLRRHTRIYQYRKVTFDVPLFPGYFFVCADERERDELLKTSNVARIIVPTDEARLLYELEQIGKALAADPTLGVCRALRRGTRVRIRNGPFTGVEGVVRAIRDNNKVRLNVDMIGQAVAVEADRDFLEPL
jgi:transcription antitermination factor NusG